MEDDIVVNDDYELNTFTNYEAMGKKASAENTSPLGRLGNMRVLRHKRVKDEVERELFGAGNATREFALELVEALCAHWDHFVENMVPHYSEAKVQSVETQFFLTKGQFTSLFLNWFAAMAKAIRQEEAVVYKVKAMESNVAFLKDIVKVWNPKVQRESKPAESKSPRRGAPFAWRQGLKEGELVAPAAALQNSSLLFDTEDVLRQKLETLFEHVDYSGMGQVTWEDCIDYFVDSTIQGKGASLARVKEYRKATVETHRREVEAVIMAKYLKEIERVMIAGRSYYALLNTETLQEQSYGHTKFVSVPSEVLCMEYCHTFGQFLVCTPTLNIHFYDAKKPEVVQSFSTRSSQCHAAFDPLHGKLFTGSRSGELTMWNMRFGIRKHSKQLTLELHTASVSGLSVLTNSGGLISTSLDGTIVLAELASGTVLQRRQYQCGISHSAFHDDYNLLLTSTFNEHPTVWVVDGNSTIPPFELVDELPHSLPIVSAECIPGTPQCVTADHNGMIKVWDVRKFQCVQTTYCDPKFANKDVYTACCTVSSTKKILAFTRQSMHHFAYNPDGEGEEDYTAHDHLIRGIAYNDYTDQFMTAAGTVAKFWDSVTGGLQSQNRHFTTEPITCACTDRLGRRLYVGTEEGAVYCYNFSNSRLVYSKRLFEWDVTALLQITPPNFPKKSFLLAVSWYGEFTVMAEQESARPLPFDAFFMEKEACIIKELDPKCVCFAPHWATVAVGDTRNCVTVVSVADPNRGLCLRLLGQHWNSDEHNSEGLKIANQEVCSVEPLGVFPGVVCAVTGGLLEVITHAPHPNKLGVFVSWRTRRPVASRATYSPTALSLVFCEPLNVLITGDEYGQICCWDMKGVMDTFPYDSAALLKIQNEVLLQTGQPQTSTLDCYSILNQCIYYFATTAAPAYAAPAEPPLVRAWRAHKAAVTSVQFIAKYYAIATGSSDRKVIIWSLDGRKIGCLDQFQSPDSSYRLMPPSAQPTHLSSKRVKKATLLKEKADALRSESPPGEAREADAEVAEPQGPIADAGEEAAADQTDLASDISVEDARIRERKQRVKLGSRHLGTRVNVLTRSTQQAPSPLQITVVKNSKTPLAVLKDGTKGHVIDVETRNETTWIQEWNDTYLDRRIANQVDESDNNDAEDSESDVPKEELMNLYSCLVDSQDEREDLVRLQRRINKMIPPQLQTLPMHLRIVASKVASNSKMCESIKLRTAPIQKLDSRRYLSSTLPKRKQSDAPDIMERVLKDDTDFPLNFAIQFPKLAPSPTARSPQGLRGSRKSKYLARGDDEVADWMAFSTRVQ